MEQKQHKVLRFLLALQVLVITYFIQSLQLVEAKCPKKLTYYNFLSSQLGNSTGGYNAVLISNPPQTQATRFGQGYAFDMPLLAGPSLSSKLVGSVQGTYVFVTQPTTDYIFVSETFIINTTTCNGTFSGVGLEQANEPIASKPIVGGTGDFALVTGIATTHLLSSQVVNSNFQAWFQYTFRFKFGTWDQD